LTGEVNEITEKEINDFLHVFAIKKIASTAEELQSYLDTLNDFLNFLLEKSLIENEKVKSLSRIIDEAKDLPLTASAAEALFELARSFPDKEYSELVSGFFTITQINLNDADLKDTITEKNYPQVLLSPKIIENIRIGMILHLEIVNTDKGWEVVEAGNVYLKLST
jgi:site-specific recombinase XerD